jgi:hypothetical protein
MKSLILLVTILSVPLVFADDRISDQEIRTILIDKSIAQFHKPCPCPYSKSPKGGQCGLNSVYSKTGRLTILCYPSNVTKKMIKAYRDQNGL